MNKEIALHNIYIRLPNMTEEDLIFFIQDLYDHKIKKEDLFHLCYQCNSKNKKLFPLFFIILTKLYPSLSIDHYSFDISLHNDFLWSDYINILYLILKRKLNEDDVIYGRLFKKLVSIIVDRFYTERYYILSVSDLVNCLPRENKQIDKETKMVKILANSYYKMYLKKENKSEEWNDVNKEINKKNKSLELYRKDISHLLNRKSGYEIMDKIFK